MGNEVVKPANEGSLLHTDDLENEVEQKENEAEKEENEAEQKETEV